jgi:hypothetical protein
MDYKTDLLNEKDIAAILENNTILVNIFVNYIPYLDLGF